MTESEKNLGLPEFGSHNWRWRTRFADARARLFLARGQLAEATKAVEQLLAWADHTRAHKYIARGLLLRAQISQDNLISVESDLHAALEMAEDLCYFPIRIEARRTLRSLYKRTGSPEKILPLNGEIEQLLRNMESSLKHPDLRRSFERGLARSVNSTEWAKNLP